MCVSVTTAGIHCDAPQWIDTIPETVMDIYFVPPHIGMYLLLDMECLWQLHYFEMLSWLADIF